MNFFAYFFWNFFSGVEYERNSGLKFFSPFLGLSHPVLAKNNARKRFFKFFEFFCYFFRNFPAGVQYKRNSGQNIFLPFSAYLIPFWLGILSKRGFLIFWIFLLFFSEFSCPGRVWAEFGTKIFFSFFYRITPVLAENKSRKRFYNF